MAHDGKHQWVSLFLVILSGSFILASYSPSELPVPSRDAGVFHYIGKGILDGGLPYRDFWDHKGPVIYYISALGLSMLGTSYWGAWFLELFSLSLAILVGYFMMKNFFGPLIALTATFFWLFGFNSLYGGFSVEEFALPVYFLQTGLFFFQANWFTRFWRVFTIGMLGCICFLLRPNLISPSLTIILFSIWHILNSRLRVVHLVRSPHMRDFAALIFSFALTFGTIFLFFAVQGAARDFYRDVFLYNILYSGNGGSRWGAFILALRSLWLPLSFAFISWLIALRSLLGTQSLSLPRETYQYVLVAFPLEIGLSLVSGYQYGHYFIAWLPVMGLLIGIVMFQVSAHPREFPERNRSRWFVKMINAVAVLLGLVLFAQNHRSFSLIISDLMKTGGGFAVDYSRFPEWALADKVLRIAGENSTILFWGNEVQYNFVMNRAAPSRYIYLYPFFMDGYFNQSMTDELLQDIRENKPLVVDVRPSLVPSLDAPNQWRSKYSQLHPVVDYIYENYEVVERFPAEAIAILERKGYVLKPREWIVWKYKE